MAAKTRVDEEQEINETREDFSRDDVWAQASVLEAPPAREGYRQRWVSVSILGKEVPHHVMKRLREGWVPRSTDTIPEDWPVPTIEHGQFAGAVGVEGMILFELPEARAQARERYFQGKTGDQNRFVNQQLNSVEKTSGMGVDIERTEKRTFSTGNRRTAVADD